jgi:Protein kinase domain
MERFRVTERIGSGGMGTVYRAFDERLQRHVALKEVDAADPERVLREAQAAARLNHPAIVTLYELGEHAGHAVLVSELVPGETLAALEVSGALCDRDVAEITADLCDALIHAHARGVVHRDIKPQNVIVRNDPGAGRRAKLMDFGIARLAGAPTLTAAGEVIGTLSYMSPEQAEGELAGPESDVYSLALTAYECWAGTNPVAGRSPAETARRIGSGVPPLRAHRPDLPEGLADTIDACLEPEPEYRPTPAELRDCLEAEGVRLDSVEPLPAVGGDDDLEPERPPLSRTRIAGLVAAALSLVALAGPLGAGGAALVLAVLCVPSLLAGATLGSLAPLAAPLLGAAGVGGGGAALGAPGASIFSRAALGAGAWMWLFTASVTLGIGPDASIAAAAPDGWASSPSLAAQTVLGPLGGLDSLLGALIFATGSVALGWLLRARHASLALLAAMIWAAAIDACLTLVGDGSLGGRPIGVVLAGAVAVAIEFDARSRARAHESGPRPAPRPAFAP